MTAKTALCYRCTNIKAVNTIKLENFERSPVRYRYKDIEEFEQYLQETNPYCNRCLDSVKTNRRSLLPKRRQKRSCSCIVLFALMVVAAALSVPYFQAVNTPHVLERIYLLKMAPRFHLYARHAWIIASNHTISIAYFSAFLIQVMVWMFHSFSPSSTVLFAFSLYLQLNPGTRLHLYLGDVLITVFKSTSLVLSLAILLTRRKTIVTRKKHFSPKVDVKMKIRRSPNKHKVDVPIQEWVERAVLFSEDEFEGGEGDKIDDVEGVVESTSANSYHGNANDNEHDDHNKHGFNNKENSGLNTPVKEIKQKFDFLNISGLSSQDQQPALNLMQDFDEKDVGPKVPISRPRFSQLHGGCIRIKQDISNRGNKEVPAPPSDENVDKSRSEEPGRLTKVRFDSIGSSIDDSVTDKVDDNLVIEETPLRLSPVLLILVISVTLNYYFFITYINPSTISFSSLLSNV